MASAASTEPQQPNTNCLPQQRHTAVILWDLDETLIALRSQLRHPGAVETVTMMEKLLGNYLDEVFYFNAFEQHDPENVCDYVAPEKLAEGQRCRDDFRVQTVEALANNLVKYLEYAVASYMTNADSARLPSTVWWQSWQQHLNNLDTFCNQWTSQAQKVLAHLRDKGCLHMAVTNTSLIAALAKLKLWGLSSYFKPEWVYSSSRRGKHAVFERALITAMQMGVTSDLVLAVGDGPEEQAAAKIYQMPFIKVTGAEDLERVVQLVDSHLAAKAQSSQTSSKDLPEVSLVTEELDRVKAQTEAHEDTPNLSGPADTDDSHTTQSSKRTRRGSR